MAKKHRILLPVLALLLIGACSRNEEIEQPTSPSGGVEVAILCDNTKEPQVYSLPDGTRTWIDDNDWASTRWDKNDKIALWATADGSNYTLNAQHFSLAYFTPSYSTAVFSSTVADMPARCPKASAARRYLTGSRQNRRAVTKGNGIFWPPIR